MKRKEIIRFLSVVLSIALLGCVFVTSVFAANEPTITVSSAEAATGDTVDITVSLANNPGIVSATLTVNFNAEDLELTNVTDAGVLGEQTHKPECTSPYTLTWANDTATTNYTVNGVIATLTFKVKDNAEIGDSYPIELSYSNSKYDIYDKDLSPVSFEVENGSVTVGAKKLLGDVNGDNTVNNTDMILLRRYCGGFTPASFDVTVADINGDNTVNNTDLILLRRYCAGLTINFKVGEEFFVNSVS